MHVTFTRLTGDRYGVDVIRASGPPARLRASPRHREQLPAAIAHLVVEREFGLRLGMFGQLAAGGDAGSFWSAPADRDTRLANRAHRLQITGRGDLGRSVALVALCTATWELESGRRATPLEGPWPLFDAAAVPGRAVATAVRLFGEIAAQWSVLGVREQVAFDWPAALTLTGRRSA